MNRPALADTFAAQSAAFAAAPYPPARERRANLTRLLEALLAHQDEFASAIDRDFSGRSRDEVLFSEVYVAVNAIRYARRHLKGWMTPRRRHVGWPLQPAEAWVLPQPVGVVGIIVPWNYPVFLSMAPLAGALAAGNRVLLKPSEYTPETSALLARIITAAFPPDLVSVALGDSTVGRAFAALPFNHLLFTGATSVGRDVMRAAAENLTPVTLELGGKSPAIVAPDANLRRAADDIVFGKLLNSGQTCIAPDYVLVADSALRPFVDALRGAVERYYPDAKYTSIINGKQYQRLHGYLEEAASRGVETITLGAERGLAPTILINPPDDLKVMREEIFGPILPLKTYGTIGEAIAYVNQHERPLALYLFTRSRQTINSVLTRTISGGVCINDTLLHIAAEDLPFGGVGASGMGHYHGQEGFDTFSQLKPVFHRRWLGLGRMLRPPHTRLHDWMARILIR
ncbi:MAG TPA: coniferyl aldehyde dehydrogenase [Bryobacteraceae bacterium]|jgi:coniferyl-aldehyde dehydrogenase|nr:coniferyl aldehyde dehydrogenase [Bryobacteraceae bacterium]